MPPVVALILTVALILYSFSLTPERKTVSAALWIPLLWITLIGTRFASDWLNVGTQYQSAADYLEGSPLDQVVFLALYLAALGILFLRRVSIAAFVSSNLWVTAFLGYCLVSVLWSDYPWTALKRWMKVTEHVAMVLVVLTERNPAQAIDVLLRRFSYLALALSVCFLKYFPELGRAFSFWTGEAINMGVTKDKNALGHICVLSGALLVSSLLSKKERYVGPDRRKALALDVLMLAFAVWLISIADAKTALVSLLVSAVLIFLLVKTPIGKSPGRVLAFLVLGVALAVTLEATFDLRAKGLEALNRDPTLTDRTFVWADVLAVENNPWLGTGFESFWLGSRADALWEKYPWRPNQAHNGYIETYINLGAIGLVLLVILIAVGFARALHLLRRDRYYGPMSLALLIAIIIFNYTDATFKALHLLYFLFFLIVTSYPDMRHSPGARQQAVLQPASTRRRVRS